jgi:hypothetical protein
MYDSGEVLEGAECSTFPLGDTSIRILLIPTCRSVKLYNNCLQYIYMETLNDKTLDYLKPQKLTPTMFKVANMFKNETEIQFNIYRILAAIMTEEDEQRRKKAYH